MAAPMRKLCVLYFAALYPAAVRSDRSACKNLARVRGVPLCKRKSGAERVPERRTWRYYCIARTGQRRVFVRANGTVAPCLCWSVFERLMWKSICLLEGKEILATMGPALL